MNSYEDKIDKVVEARRLLLKLVDQGASQHVLDLSLIALETLARLVNALENLQRESEGV